MTMGFQENPNLVQIPSVIQMTWITRVSHLTMGSKRTLIKSSISPSMARSAGSPESQTHPNKCYNFRIILRKIYKFKIA